MKAFTVKQERAILSLARKLAKAAGEEAVAEYATLAEVDAYVARVVASEKLIDLLKQIGKEKAYKEAASDRA